jgi:hypothetical protein
VLVEFHQRVILVGSAKAIAAFMGDQRANRVFHKEVAVIESGVLATQADRLELFNAAKSAFDKEG